MSNEAYRKMTAALVIAMLAVAEAQQVQQNARFHNGPKRADGMMQGMPTSTVQQEGKLITEQMEAIMHDPDFKVMATQFAEQLEAMTADAKLQEQLKPFAEQMEAMKANPKFQDDIRVIAEQMEATMASTDEKEQGQAFAKHLQTLVSSSSYQAEVAHVTKQVETILANPHLQETLQLFAEKVKTDPHFQRQEAKLAKEMKAWTNAEELATMRVDFLDNMADRMIDRLFDSALMVSTLGSSAVPVSRLPIASSSHAFGAHLSASHSRGVTSMQEAESRLPVHVPRAAAVAAPVAASAMTVFLEQIAPRLGTVIANVMFFTSLPPVLELRKNKNLGETNPIPYVVTVGNCLAWVAYGLLTQNPYVLISNTPGVLLGLFYTMTAVKLADDATRGTLEKLLLTFMAIVLGSGIWSSLILKDMAARTSLAGYVANAIVFLFYGSGLSTLGQVFKDKSSASISAPQNAINVLNGGFWTGYGMAVKDPYIAVPNGVGVVLGAIQLFLCAIFPGKKKAD